MVPDEKIIETIYLSSNQFKGKKVNLFYYYSFDTDNSAESEIVLVNDINKKMESLSIAGRCEGLEESRESFFSIYGGLFFLGVFLGVLFFVLVLYWISFFRWHCLRQCILANSHGLSESTCLWNRENTVIS